MALEGRQAARSAQGFTQTPHLSIPRGLRRQRGVSGCPATKAIPRKYLELAAPDLENSAPRTVGENGRHCSGADGCVDLSPPQAPLQQQIPSPGASRVSPNPPPWKRKNLSLAISMREAPVLRIYTRTGRRNRHGGSMASHHRSSRCYGRRVVACLQDAGSAAHRRAHRLRRSARVGEEVEPQCWHSEALKHLTRH